MDKELIGSTFTQEYPQQSSTRCMTTGVGNRASKCVWHDCHDKFTASRRFAAIPDGQLSLGVFVPAMILGRGGQMSSLNHALSALQSEQKILERQLKQVKRAVAVLHGLGGRNRKGGVRECQLRPGLVSQQLNVQDGQNGERPRRNEGEVGIRASRPGGLVAEGSPELVPRS